MRRALLVALVMYLVLTFRASIRLYEEIQYWLHRPPPIKFAESSLEWLVAWESAPLFRPHALACVDHHIFLADDFHVFELDDRRNLRQICKVDRPIRDLTASCSSDSCQPVLLLRSVSDGDSEENPELELHACQDGEQSSTLLQTLGDDVDHANLYHSQSEDVLVTTRGDELLKNSRTEKGDTWIPEWSMGDVHSKSLRGIAADSDFTMLFTSGHVQIRSSTSRKPIGSFQIPPSIGNLTDACRIPGTLKSLTLSYEGDPHLHVLTFPGFDDLVLDRSKETYRYAPRRALEVPREDHRADVASPQQPKKALIQTGQEIRLGPRIGRLRKPLDLSRDDTT